MVATVSGNSLGLNLTSLTQLGSQGTRGTADFGGMGERAYVNVATGNLVLQRQDEYLAASGVDLQLLRTYNSQGQLNDPNAQDWRFGPQRRIALVGSLGAVNSQLVRTADDGSQQSYLFTFVQGQPSYLSTQGPGAHDTVRVSGAQQLTWSDGDSGVVEQYDLNAAGRLTQTRDRDGNVLIYDYDNSGLLVRIVSNLNTQGANNPIETTWLDYDANRNLTQIRTQTRDATGNSSVQTTRTRYRYDVQQRLVAVLVDLSPEDNDISDGRVYSTLYSYDGASQRLSSLRSSDGQQLDITYTQIGSEFLVASLTNALGQTTRYNYDRANRITTVTDALGQSTSYRVDPQGQLLSISTALDGAPASIESFTYNSAGDLLSCTDANGQTTSYQYDGNGNLISQIDPLGNFLTRRYNSANQVLLESTKLNNGGALRLANTRYVYDANQHLRFVISPEGCVTEHRYDARGQRQTTLTYSQDFYPSDNSANPVLPSENDLQNFTSLAQPHSTRSDTTWDFRGQVRSVTTYAQVDAQGVGVRDGSQQTTQFVYDPFGRLLQTVHLEGGVEQNSYDGLGRLLTSQNVLQQTTRYQYFDSNQVVISVQPNGLTTQKIYDRAAQLVRVVEQAPQGNLVPGQTRYDYDLAGRLTRTQDPTGLSQWNFYDRAGRSVGQIDPNGRLSEYRYDGNGQLTQTIRYATPIDPARLASFNPNSLPALGSLRPARSAQDQSQCNFYDRAGQLVWQSDALGNVREYRYDGAGRVSSIIDYATPLASAAAPGTLPAASAQDRRIDKIYDNDGLLLVRIDGAGYVSEYRYDGAGRVIQEIRYATPSSQRNTTDLNLLIPPANSAQDQVTTTFYNARDQIIGTIDSAGYLSASCYDANGNLSQRVRYANAVNPNADLNADLASLYPTLSSQDQSEVWQYDNLNQLVLHIDAQGTRTSYQYDSMGYLSARTVAAASDEARSVLQRYDAKGRVLAQLSGVGSALLQALVNPSSGQIEAIWNQYATRYQYDAAGRRLSMSESNGLQTRKTVYYYNSLGQQVASINSLGEVVSNQYNTLGQIVRTTQHSRRLAGVNSVNGGLISNALQQTLNSLANPAEDQSTTYSYEADYSLTSANVAQNSPFTCTIPAETFSVLDTHSPLSYQISNLPNWLSFDPSSLRFYGVPQNSAVGTVLIDIQATDRTGASAMSSLTINVANVNDAPTVVKPLDNQRATEDTPFSYTIPADTFADVDVGDTLTYSVSGLPAWMSFNSATRTLSGTPSLADIGIVTLQVSVTDRSGQSASTNFYVRVQTRVTAARAALARSASSLASTSQLLLDGRNALDVALAEQVDVDLVTGQLRVNQQDEHRVAQGLGLDVLRAYQSAGSIADHNNDAWRLGIYRSVTLYGARNQNGSALERFDQQGLSSWYRWDSTRNAYINSEAAGADERISYDASTNQWHWYAGAPVGLVESYAASNGAVLSSQDSWGNRLDYCYNDRGLITEIRNNRSFARGESYYFDYDASNNLTQIRTLEFVAASGTTTSTTSTKTRVRYGYDSLNRLSSVSVDLSPEDNSISDGQAYVTRYRYQGNSQRIDQISHNGNVVLTIAYSVDGRVERVSNALGASVSYSYGSNDGAGQTTSVCDALGNSTLYQYDARGQLVQITRPGADQSGLTQQFAYNARGELSAIVDGLGQQVVYEYDANGNQTLQRDAAGNTITRRYDDANRLISETLYRIADPDGAGAQSASDAQTTHYVYDAAQNNFLRFVISPAGRVTEHRYNALGQRIASLQYSAASYAPATSSTDPSENDVQNWLATLSDLSQTQRSDMEYDFRGQLTRTTRYAALDAQGQTTSTAASASTQYVYDGQGNLLKSIDANGAVTQYSYDGLGRLLSTRDALGQLTVNNYDDLNRLSSVTQANGLTILQSYDAAGRLISSAQNQATSTLATTRYWYDAAGQRIMQQDPSGQRQWYVYDQSGRQVAEIDASGHLSESLYNANNQVVRTISYATPVDLSRLLTTQGEPSNPSLASLRPLSSGEDRSTWKVYDAAHRLWRSVDAEGYLSETRYDGCGRVLETTRYANPMQRLPLTNAAQISDLQFYRTSNDQPFKVNTVEALRARYVLIRKNNPGILALAEVKIVVAGRDISAQTRVTAHSSYNGGTAVAGFDLSNIRDGDTTPASGVWASRSIANTTAWVQFDLGSVQDIDRIEIYSPDPDYGPAQEHGGNYTVWLGASDFASVANLASQSGDQILEQRLASDPSLRAVVQAGTFPETWGWLFMLQAASDRQNQLQSSTQDRSEHHFYDNDGLLRATLDAAGYASEYRYDHAGRLVQRLAYTERFDVAALRQASVAELDLQQLLEVLQRPVAETRETKVLEPTVPTAPTVPNSPTTATEPPAPNDSAPWVVRQTDYFYNALGQQIAEIDADGYLTERVYDAQGRLREEQRYSSVLAQRPRVSAALDAATTAASSTASSSTPSTAGAATSNPATDPTDPTDPLARWRPFNQDDDQMRTLVYDALGRLVHEYRYRAAASQALDSAYQYNSSNLVVQRTQRSVAVSDVDNPTSTTATLGSARRERSEYDLLGRLLRQTSSLGVALLEDDTPWARSERQRLFGSSFAILANLSASQRATINDAYSTRYRYDAAGHLLSSSDGQGNRTRYFYNSAAQLRYTVDGANQVSENRYDRFGALASTIGYSTALSSADVSSLTTAWGALISDGGVLSTSQQSAFDNLLNLRRSDSDAVTNKTFNQRGLVTLVQSALGQLSGSARGDNATRSEQYLYNAFGEVAVQIVPGNAEQTRITRYDYDQRGLRTQTQISSSAGPVSNEQSRYDAFGRLLERSDARGLVTRYHYDQDPAGRAIVLTEQNGERSTLSAYDGFARVLYQIDALGQTTRYEYDASQDALSVITPEGLQTTSWRNVFGETVKIRDPQGGESSYEYDVSGRLMRSVDALGVSQELRYDLLGQAVQRDTFDTAGASLQQQRISYRYDAANRVLSRQTQIDGQVTDSNAYLYDGQGRVLWQQDALGVWTQNEYNAAGQLLARTVDSANNPDGSVKNGALALRSELRYDVAGNTIAVVEGAGTAATRTTVYRYNALQQRIQTYNVDAQGQAQGLVRSYRYDAAGQVFAEQHSTADAPDTPLRLSYTLYDAFGQLRYRIDTNGTNGTNSSSVVRYDYDLQGRLLMERHYAQTLDLSSWSMPSDPDQARSALTQSIASSLADSAQDQLRLQVYDADGRLRYRVDGLGQVQETRYDAARRSTQTISYSNAIDSATLATWSASQLTDAQRSSLLQSDALAASLTPDRAADRSSYRFDDALGRERYTIDASGALHERRYNALGKLAQRIAYAQRYALESIPANNPLTPLTLEQLAAWSVQQRRANQDRVTDLVYDSAQRLQYQIDPLGYITDTRYDALGQVVQVTQYATAYPRAWAADGQPRIVNNSDLSTWLDQRLANGQKANLDPQNDRQTRNLYDTLGRLRFSIDALGNVSEKRYDALGNTSVALRYVRPYSPVSALALDSASALTSLVSWANSNSNEVRRERFVYNSLGWRLFSVDAANYVTRNDYDAWGKLIRRTVFSQATSSSATDSALGQALATLSASNDPGARVTQTRYDPLGRVSEQIDALGYRTTMRYDTFGQLISTTQADGTNQAVRTDYQYDVIGQRLRTTAAAGTSQAVTSLQVYDAFGQVIMSSDARGVELSEQDSAWAQAERQRLGYARNAAQLNITQREQLRAAYSTFSQYDAGGNLTQTRDALGATVRTRYNAFGQALQVTDARGYSAYYYFDQGGRNLAQIDAAGYLTQLQYNLSGKATRITRYAQPVAVPIGDALPSPGATNDSSQAVTTQLEYDALDRLVRAVDAEGGVESYSYPDLNSKITVNKLGGRTTTRYDARDHIVEQQTQVLDQDQVVQTLTTRMVYDARGNRIQQIDNAAAAPSLQRITDFEYDLLDRATRVLGPSTSTYDFVNGWRSNWRPSQSSEYDARGNIVRTTDANGNVSLAYYDALNHVVAEVSTTGTLIERDFDAVGNITRIRTYGGLLDPRSLTVNTRPAPRDAQDYRLLEQQYDANNQITRSIQWRADVLVNNQQSNNPVSGIQAQLITSSATRFIGLASDYQYTANGKLARETRGLVLDDRGVVIDNVSQLATRYHYYDKLGQEILQIDPEYYVTAWQRDQAGNIVQETRYAQVLDRAELDLRLAAQLRQGEERLSIERDVSLIQAVLDDRDRANRTTLRSYNRNNLQLSETLREVESAALDTNNGTLLDLNGQALSQTDSQGNRLSSDAILTRADQTTRYRYDAAGNRISQTTPGVSLGSSSVTRYRYDSANQLRWLSQDSFSDYQNQTVSQRTVYEYDNFGQVVREIRLGSNDSLSSDDRITQYQYDNAGRRTSVSDAANQTTYYGYDANGNNSAQWYWRADASSTDNSTGQWELRTRSFDGANRLIAQSVDNPAGGVASVPTQPEPYHTVGKVRANGQPPFREYTQYNAWGEVVAKTTLAEGEQRYEYDRIGQVTRSNAQGGINKIYLYDSLGRAVIQMESQTQDLYRFNDAASAFNDSAVKKTRSFFDLRGQVIAVAQPVMQGVLQLYSPDDLQNLSLRAQLGSAGSTNLQTLGGGLFSLGKSLTPSWNGVWWNTLSSGLTVSATTNNLTEWKQYYDKKKEWYGNTKEYRWTNAWTYVDAITVNASALSRYYGSGFHISANVTSQDQPNIRFRGLFGAPRYALGSQQSHSHGVQTAPIGSDMRFGVGLFSANATDERENYYYFRHSGQTYGYTINASVVNWYGGGVDSFSLSSGSVAGALPIGSSDGHYTYPNGLGGARTINTSTTVNTFTHKIVVPKAGFSDASQVIIYRRSTNSGNEVYESVGSYSLNSTSRDFLLIDAPDSRGDYEYLMIGQRWDGQITNAVRKTISVSSGRSYSNESVTSVSQLAPIMQSNGVLRFFGLSFNNLTPASWRVRVRQSDGSERDLISKTSLNPNDISLDLKSVAAGASILIELYDNAGQAIAGATFMGQVAQNNAGYKTLINLHQTRQIQLNALPSDGRTLIINSSAADKNTAPITLRRTLNDSATSLVLDVEQLGLITHTQSYRDFNAQILDVDGNLLWSWQARVDGNGAAWQSNGAIRNLQVRDYRYLVLRPFNPANAQSGGDRTLSSASQVRIGYRLVGASNYTTALVKQKGSVSGTFRWDASALTSGALYDVYYEALDAQGNLLPRLDANGQILRDSNGQAITRTEIGFRVDSANAAGSAAAYRFEPRELLVNPAADAKLRGAVQLRLSYAKDDEVEFNATSGRSEPRYTTLDLALDTNLNLFKWNMNGLVSGQLYRLRYQGIGADGQVLRDAQGVALGVVETSFRVDGDNSVNGSAAVFLAAAKQRNIQIERHQVYNAFGEVAQERDGNAVQFFMQGGAPIVGALPGDMALNEDNALSVQNLGGEARYTQNMAAAAAVNLNNVPATLPASSTSLNGRYVMVRKNSSSWLALAEVKIFAAGVNIAPQAAVTCSGIYLNNTATDASGCDISNLRDGDTTTQSGVWVGIAGDDWVQFDLGSSRSLSRIEVYSPDNNYRWGGQHEGGSYTVFVSDSRLSNRTLAQLQADTTVKAFRQDGSSPSTWGWCKTIDGAPSTAASSASLNMLSGTLTLAPSDFPVAEKVTVYWRNRSLDAAYTLLTTQTVNRSATTVLTINPPATLGTFDYLIIGQKNDGTVTNAAQTNVTVNQIVAGVPYYNQTTTSISQLNPFIDTAGQLHLYDLKNNGISPSAWRVRVRDGSNERELVARQNLSSAEASVTVSSLNANSVLLIDYYDANGQLLSDGSWVGRLRYTSSGVASTVELRRARQLRLTGLSNAADTLTLTAQPWPGASGSTSQISRVLTDPKSQILLNLDELGILNDSVGLQRQLSIEVFDRQGRRLVRYSAQADGRSWTQDTLALTQTALVSSRHISITPYQSDRAVSDPRSAQTQRLRLGYRAVGATSYNEIVIERQQSTVPLFVWDVSTLPRDTLYEVYYEGLDANAASLGRQTSSIRLDSNQQLRDPASEDYATSLEYNTRGQLVRKYDPKALVAAENGLAREQRGLTRYFYANDGSLIGVQDAAKKLNTQWVQSAIGAEAVTRQWRADGSNKLYGYDVFGQRRVERDANAGEDAHQIDYNYDNLGRLIELRHAQRADGSRAVDQYAYDILNQRIRRISPAGYLDQTFYDSWGRVTRVTLGAAGSNSSNAAPQTTTYSYQRASFNVNWSNNTWDNTGVLRSNALSTQTLSGWQRTTTDNLGRSLTDTLDSFGRLWSHSDLGGRVFTYTYNYAGLVTSQRGSSGSGNTAAQDIQYSYYDNGYLQSVVDNAVKTISKYQYDNNGNRTFEGYYRTDRIDTIAQSIISYDRLNRITQIIDPNQFTVAYQYDAVGNRRNVTAQYFDPVSGRRSALSQWYTYDALERFTISMGELQNGRIVRGTQGISLTYDKAGNRVQALYGYDNHREDYQYENDGYLKNTWVYNSAGSLQYSAQRSTDLAGRVTQYVEQDASGRKLRNVTRTYNSVNLQLSEVDSVDNSRSSNTYDGAGSLTSNVYTRTNTAGQQETTTSTWTYALWDQAKQTSQRVTVSVNGESPRVIRRPGLSELFYDANGHLSKAIDYGEVNRQTGLSSGTNGRVLYYISDIDGQILARDEYLTPSNFNFDTITPSTYNPPTFVNGNKNSWHKYFFAAGRTIGNMGNNGSEIKDYAQQLREREQQLNERLQQEQQNSSANNAQANDLRFKKFTPSSSVDFDNNYQPINAEYPAATPSNYTVRNGDTLQSISQTLWGDGGMWYLLAEANGLNISPSTALLSNSNLVIPNKVTNFHNNASTYRVYNAGVAIGDTSPTLPSVEVLPPPAPHGKKGCGGLGMIIVAVVAVVATVLSAGAAAVALGSVATGTSTMAAGVAALAGGSAFGVTIGAGIASATVAAIGGAMVGAAVGSIVAQGVGIAFGVQDQFSWKQVAVAGLSAAVSAGIGAAIGASSSTIKQISDTVLGASLQAGLSNTITQGVSIATGLQKRFDWGAVATSAVAGGTAKAMNQVLQGWQPNGFSGQVAKQFVVNAGSGSAALLASSQSDTAPAWHAMLSSSFGSALGNTLVAAAKKAELSAINQQAKNKTSFGLDGITDKTSETYTRENLMKLPGLQIKGQGDPDLVDAMEVLAGERDPDTGKWSVTADQSEVDEALVAVARIHDVPLEKIRSDYEKVTSIRDGIEDRIYKQGGELMPFDETNDADKRVPMLSMDEADGLPDNHQHMASNNQLRFGKMVGDSLGGLDPVMSALLSPTGGMIGPGNRHMNPTLIEIVGGVEVVTSHAIAHDAAGYLYNYIGIGPGYQYVPSYIGLLPTSSPLAGQLGGLIFFNSSKKTNDSYQPMNSEN